MKRNVIYLKEKEVVMFDNFSIVINDYKKEEFKNFLDNYVKKSPTIRGGWFQVDWRNFRIKYFPNQEKIKVSNSLHKWYNSEVIGIGEINYNDFTLLHVKEAISYLEVSLGRNASEMKLLGLFEYGININTNSIKPYDIIDRYTSIVTTSVNPFYAFYEKYNKPSSKFCSFSNYKIKAYDKSKEAGLTTSNIFRFEIVHHNSIKTRQIFGKKVVTLKDLGDVEIWDKCFNSLINSYNSIRMLGFPQSGVNDYAKMLCYSHPIIRKDYKSDLRKIKKDLKDTHDSFRDSENSPHFLIKKGLVDNYQKLITN
ncbi:hypothetical protein [Flavobacterium sp.]|uniref:hypothetical protein n=1 Tax=Flavobacterium sp. TaxID=239 RepID=UPI00286C6939|nr:hypothetical protein [Flavobacterium sp.]